METISPSRAVNPSRGAGHSQEANPSRVAIPPRVAVRWPEQGHRFEPELISAFLIWAAEQEASDIKLEGDQPARIYIHGRACAVTDYRLQKPELIAILENIYNATGLGLINDRQAIDFSHRVAISREEHLRFRVCVAGTTARERTFEITFRLLPMRAPTFDEIAMEEPIREAFLARKGLNLITGETGSGKSTSIAAGIRALLGCGCGQILSFENPIEFAYADIESEDAWISQTEVPTQVPSFHQALVDAMRRYPRIIMVGECRDRETIEAAINAGQQGSPVYTTTHSRTVADTLDRLVNIFPGSERDSRSYDLLKLLHLVVSQRLVPKACGTGRIAIREWFVFEDAFVTTLFKEPRHHWHGMIHENFRHYGRSMQVSAVKAHEQGLIDETTVLSLCPGLRPDQEGRSA